MTLVNCNENNFSANTMQEMLPHKIMLIDVRFLDSNRIIILTSMLKYDFKDPNPCISSKQCSGIFIYLYLKSCTSTCDIIVTLIAFTLFLSFTVFNC